MNKIKLDINLRMFFEGIKTRENPYTKEIKFELSDFDNFGEDIFKVTNNDFKNILDDSNILIDTTDEVNLHQSVLDLFFKFRREQAPALR
jgi:hypothetical protein